jgi:hypothetical protein
MALITTADILLRVRDTIQDAAGVRWPDAECKRYLLDGQVKVAHLIPGAGPTGYVTHALATGIEQSITSSDGRTVSRVLDVVCNQTGSTRGRPVRKIAKDQMDEQEPSWTSDTPAAVVLYWMPHELEPRDFYVQPPASGASVRAKVSLVPNDADVIEVIDAARDALYHYVVGRCWSKDATYAKGSADHMALFQDELKLMAGGDASAYGKVQERQKPR